MGPIREMLDARQGRTRFHMPGHKGRLGPVDPARDVTELLGTDDLYAPSGAIAEAEKLLSKSCGAGASILLTGGATAGMHAMALALLRPGDRLLMKRSAHHSALSACALAGAEPVFVPPDADLADAARELRPDAVLVTRPDYFGRVEELPDAGVPVLVDAAHGAHFNWWESPPSAMRAGANAAVESAHKTLGALTGGAWMHFRDPDIARRARQMLRIVMSSSPSYLILQSLDDARAWMDERGAEALSETAGLCGAVREEIARMPGLCCEDLGDPTRLYVGTAGRGLSGWSAYRQLREMGVELELADAGGVLAIATVFDRAEDFAHLTGALRRLEGDGSALPALPAPVYGEPCASLRAAVLARTRRVELKNAAGEISARSVGAYPPGSAIVAPGERFTAAAIDYLLRTKALGAALFGAEGGFVEAADKEDALDAPI